MIERFPNSLAENSIRSLTITYPAIVLDGRPKRSIMNSYGNADGPIVLNHLLKQPILSFGPWFAPSRAKRFNGNVDYADLDAFYPQPITQRRLRRNLRQHKRMLLSL